MKIKFSTRQVLIWDNISSSMVIRWKVSGTLLGHNKSVIFELNPFYVVDAEEIQEAKDLLTLRIKKRWKNLKDSSTNDAQEKTSE